MSEEEPTITLSLNNSTKKKKNSTPQNSKINSSKSAIIPQSSPKTKTSGRKSGISPQKSGEISKQSNKVISQKANIKSSKSEFVSLKSNKKQTREQDENFDINVDSKKEINTNKPEKKPQKNSNIPKKGGISGQKSGIVLKTSSIVPKKNLISPQKSALPGSILLKKNGKQMASTPRKTKNSPLSPKNKSNKSPVNEQYPDNDYYSEDYDYDYEESEYESDFEKKENITKKGQITPQNSSRKISPQCSAQKITPQNSSKKLTPEKKPIVKKEYSIPQEFSETYKQLCHENDLTPIFKNLQLYQKEFISESTSLADKQAQFWYHSVLKQLANNGIKFNSNVTYFEYLSRRAKEFFDSHRISLSSKSHYSFRAFVGGPSQSGKSTLLATLAEQFLIELVSSDLYKSIFVFGLDYSQFVLSIQDMTETLRIFATATINYLAAQRPLLSQYADSLIRSFVDIPYGYSSFPKSFAASPDFRTIAPQVRKIIEELKILWKDNTAGNSVLISIFLLPSRLAHIFGFKSVAVFFDHFDLLNLQFIASQPFSETPLNIFPHEQAKQFLNGTNFILSYRDSSQFNDALPKAEDECITLRSLEIISTLDLVKDDEQSDQEEKKKGEEFIISVDGGHPKIVLKKSMFGGCPNYLCKWNEMKENADLLDQIEDTREKEEQQLILNAIVEKHLNEIFQLTSNNHFVVKNVIRN